MFVWLYPNHPNLTIEVLFSSVELVFAAVNGILNNRWEQYLPINTWSNKSFKIDDYQILEVLVRQQNAKFCDEYPNSTKSQVGQQGPVALLREQFQFEFLSFYPVCECIAQGSDLKSDKYALKLLQKKM